MGDLTTRVLHDGSVAVWFGGSLMGAVGLNGAAAEVADPADRARVAAIGWRRWQPVSALAAATHVVAGIGITRANRGRIAAQRGVASMATAKAALTGAALAAEVYASMLGHKVGDADHEPVDGATEPSTETPDQVAAAQRRLRIVQWSVPALTGTLVAITAVMGEHQRPAPVVGGVLGRLRPDR